MWILFRRIYLCCLVPQVGCCPEEGARRKKWYLSATSGIRVTQVCRGIVCWFIVGREDIEEDKSTLEEFFKLIRKLVQRSEAKRSENGAHNRPGDRPGWPPSRLVCTTWPPSRLVCTTCTGMARSTARSIRMVDRLARVALNWSRLTGLVDQGQGRSTGRSTNRRVLLSWTDLDSFSVFGSNPIGIF